jgi:hypothetical protein
MAHVRYYNAVEKAKAEYEQSKGSLKREIIAYFLTEGAPKEKLAEILNGVKRVHSGEPVESLFSARHHKQVVAFAAKYEAIVELEQALQNALDDLQGAEDADVRDLSEV